MILSGLVLGRGKVLENKKLCVRGDYMYIHVEQVNLLDEIHAALLLYVYRYSRYDGVEDLTARNEA